MAVTTGDTPTKSQISVPLPSSRAYDILKHIALYVLPVFLTFYMALANIWHWPAQAQVEQTVAAINALVGGLVMFFRWLYNNIEPSYDGTINIKETDDRKIYQLDLAGDPEEIDGKTQIVLKVNPST